MTTQPPQSADEIRAALRNLPRVAAGSDFNERLRSRSPLVDRRRSWPRLAAAAALLIALGAGIQISHRHSQELDRRHQRAALAERHEELRRDLAALRTQAASSPRLYLGETSDIDLILDLEPWMDPSASVLPAAYSNARP